MTNKIFSVIPILLFFCSFSLFSMDSNVCLIIQLYRACKDGNLERVRQVVDQYKLSLKKSSEVSPAIKRRHERSLRASDHGQESDGPEDIAACVAAFVNTVYGKNAVIVSALRIRNAQVVAQLVVWGAILPEDMSLFYNIRGTNDFDTLCYQLTMNDDKRVAIAEQFLQNGVLPDVSSSGSLSHSRHSSVGGVVFEYEDEPGTGDRPGDSKKEDDISTSRKLGDLSALAALFNNGEGLFFAKGVK